MPEHSTTLTSLVDHYLLPAWRRQTLPFERYWRKWRRDQHLRLAVPRCSWTRGREGIVGTAFDYMVGNIWAGRSLSRVLERVGNARPVPRWVIPHLSSIIAVGPTHRDPEGTLRRHRDYFRCLGVLAGLDATYRSRSAPPPEWLILAKPTDLTGFRRLLRENYPVEFVNEMRALLDRARLNLPRASSVIYNPDLSGDYGGIDLNADADLILDDLLLELKVSVHPKPHLKTVLQLLGYVVLAAHRGTANIKRIG